MKRTLIAASAAATLLTATVGSAATVTVEKQNATSIFKDENGQNLWYVPTKLTVGTYQSGWVAAGAFRLKDSNGNIDDFLAFCMEPLMPMNTPIDYEMGSLFTTAVNHNLQTLAANAWDLVTNQITAGAFQMAAWEITTETAASFDINSGFFQIDASNRKSNKAEVLAQTWLTKVETNIWEAPQKEYLILNTQGNQDLLTNIQSMPIPASGLLLIGGLVGAGTFARRKKAAK